MVTLYHRCSFQAQVFTCKGKKYSGCFVQAAGLKMQDSHTMQYDGHENTQGTVWSVGFSRLFKTYFNTGLLVKKMAYISTQ